MAQGDELNPMINSNASVSNVRFERRAEVGHCSASLIDGEQKMGCQYHLIRIHSEGVAHIVYEEGVRVGLIICEKGGVAFLSGHRISEEIILPAFRGRSLASRAQRLLCNHLQRSSREPCLMTGTIIPENLPSIKTAEKAGRTCILRFEYLPVMFS
ncbi:GNAT family protein [Klebsiella aerogenes]